MKRIVTMLMALLFAAPSTAGYTANITSKQTAQVVYVHINAYHSEDEVYNACEIELTYNADKLRFNSESSTLGCSAYRDTDGRLMLIDFGADKPLGKSVYVLAFDVIGTGKAKIHLTRAAFCIAEKAATSDLEPISNKPNGAAVWVGYHPATVLIIRRG